MIFRCAPVYPAETPLRKMCNAFRMNFISRILRDVKGVGCKIEKNWTRGGYGWRIIVDGRSTDELPPDGSSPFSTALDHSFKPTQTGEKTATVSPGFIYDRFGVARVISAATDWADGVIDFTTLRRWYVQMKYYSYGGSIGMFEEILWVGTAGGFPSMRPDEYTVNFPILELPDGTWASLKRLQTNEIIEALHYDGIPGAPDTEEPWPTPPAYDEIPGAPDTEEPWPVEGNHSELSDIADQTVGDDHRGNRTAATGIGTPARHPYIHANGNASRNAMGADSALGDALGQISIGVDDRTLYSNDPIAGSKSLDYDTRETIDQNGDISIDWNYRKLNAVVPAGTGTNQTVINWHEGKLFALISATMREVAAWFTGELKAMVGASLVTTLDWFKQELKGSFWTVTDTTEAGETGTGALVVDGGIYAAKGVYAKQESVAAAGQFDGNAGVSASLGAGSFAGSFVDATNAAQICDGTYAYNASVGKIHAVDGFAANGLAGMTTTFVDNDGNTITVTGGIITAKTAP